MKAKTLPLYFLALMHIGVAAQELASCHFPVASPAVRSNPCDADAPTCAVWQQFRKERPYPYQAISLRQEDQDGTATLILSELPPVGSTGEISALLQAIFGVSPEAVHRMRFPVGLDGWLEDWVIKVKYQPQATAPVPDADGNAVAVPARLADQLRFLNGALFGTASVHYIDLLVERTASKELLPNLQVTTGELLAQAGAKEALWRPWPGADAPLQSFTQIGQSNASALFTDSRQRLAALVIPQNANLKSLQGLFRQFAVGTDHLVGAVRPKKGGLVLLARMRQVSLRVLPPMRFETLEILSGTRTSLGQSYERQRVFAGKVRSGSYTGWDWAPIYLSPQLQDTELGSLLNIADQLLKSWSQCGNVRYAAFDYPVPPTFPFDPQTASDWFHEATGTSSLIYNWNTNGFSTASDTAVGRIITTSGTAALPVSYILPSNTKGYADEAAREGSRVGSEYFTQLSDPMLARVAQNVLLFQILHHANPFRRADGAGPGNAAGSRSELVAGLLVKRTEQWLSELQNDAVLRESDGGRIITAMTAKLGMSRAQLAQLLANPEKQQQELLRLARSLELRRNAILQLNREWEELGAEYETLAERGRADFIAQCRGLGGSITRQKDRLLCNYKSSTEAVIKDSTQARRDEMVKQRKAQDAELEKLETGYLKEFSALNKLAAQGTAAEVIAVDLRRLASYSADLDGILAHLLEAARKTASKGSIQTPTLVLSQDVADGLSVGGHNIDPEPWLVKADRRTTVPRVRMTGGQTEVLVAAQDAGNGAAIARSVVTQAPIVMAAPRDLDIALQMPPSARSSFLDRLAQRGKLDVPPDLPDRARVCNCDIYLEGGDAGTMFSVRVKPPPPGPPRILYGHEAAVEHLAAMAPGKTVVFTNVSTDRASAISESAARTTRPGGKQDGIEEKIGVARKLFRNPIETIGELVSWRTRQGSNLTARGDMPFGELAQKLRSVPEWRTASAVEQTGVLAENTIVIVQVKFGNSTNQRIEVKAFGADGIAISPSAEHTQLALRKARVDDTLQDGLGRLADQIIRDSKDRGSVEFYLRSTGVETVRREQGGVPRSTPEAP